MLETLDEIDWSSFSDCYGPATRVPDMVRGLTSPKSDEQVATLDELGNQICHQASCCEATPLVIPFLIELCKHQRIKNRDQILNLLLHIAVGLDSDLLYDHTGISEYMSKAAGQAANYRPAAIGVDCYCKVEDAVPLFISLLVDANKKVRINAAYNLAWFPKKGRTSLPRLREQLKLVKTSTELANLIISIGLLEFQADVSRPIKATIKPLIKHTNQLVRYASAVYLNWHDPGFDSIASISELIENESYDGKIPFFNYCLSGYTLNASPRSRSNGMSYRIRGPWDF